MLAVVKSKPELGIEIREVPEPQMKGKDEVLVKVKACGICGTDMHFYEWQPHSRWITLPRILGHELTGEILQVREDVRNFKVGDKIVTETWGGCGYCYHCRTGQFNLCINQKRIGQQVDGGMAEYVVLPERNLYKIPQEMPYKEAAVIEPVGVAIHAFEQCNVKPGDSIVILGPGPIGLLAGMIAKAGGASQVFITGIDQDKERLALASKLGLRAINVQKENAEAVIKEVTDGVGADIAIDTTGAAGSLSQALKMIRLAGQVVLVGMAPAGEFNYTEIVEREAKVYGSWRRQPITWLRAIRLVSNGIIDVRPIVSHTFNLKDAAEGFKLLHERKGMKILIES